MFAFEFDEYTKKNFNIIINEGVEEKHLYEVMIQEAIDKDDVEAVAEFINKVANLWIDFKNNNGECSPYPILSSRDGNRKVGGYKVHA